MLQFLSRIFSKSAKFESSTSVKYKAYGMAGNYRSKLTSQNVELAKYDNYGREPE